MAVAICPAVMCIKKQNLIRLKTKENFFFLKLQLREIEPSLSPICYHNATVFWLPISLSLYILRLISKVLL